MGQENVKLLSEISNYEIINISDGEKYNYLQNNDLVVDDEGNIKFIVINFSKNKFGIFKSTNEFLEKPWSCVKKIGVRTIILDASEEEISKSKL